jgi:hypothetical protein
MILWIEHLNADIFADFIKGFALIAFLVLSQGLIWFLKFRLRRRYQYETTDLANLDEVQAVSLAYFRRRQILDIIRAVLLMLTLLVGVLFYNTEAFSFLALALGAVVLNQKENINSIIGYFFLLANYNVGDDIGIIGTLGEIVRVGLFQTVLAGKDETGEYNGKRVSIPNYQFLLNVIDRRDLKANTYRQVTIQIPYTKDLFKMPFADFLAKLRAYLDELLPKRNLARVGSYRGFAGSQYKINFDYNENTGVLMVKIAFVSRERDAIERKESILTFVESLKA